MQPQFPIMSSIPLVASNAAPRQQGQMIQCNFSIPARGDVTVNISVHKDDNPQAYGLDILFPTIPSNSFSGFPVTQGTISTTKKGYASIYGWTQLWKENDTDWVFDWAPVQDELNWPFVWFGPEAQLFDGPTRVGVLDLDWTARSFMTYIDDSLMTRSVRCVVGFEWGFWIRNGSLAIKPLIQLQNLDWDMHLQYLSVVFPGWEFMSSQE